MTKNLDILLTIIGGLIAFIKWVYEYARKNNWDRNKYMVDVLKEFHSSEAVQAAEKMLDWNEIMFKYDSEIIIINDDELFNALQTHDTKHDFNDKEIIVREIFDIYFDGLTKLIVLTKCKLISEKNLIILMKYWFQIIIGVKKSKSPILVNQFLTYIKFYGYDELYEFLIKTEKIK